MTTPQDTQAAQEHLGALQNRDRLQAEKAKLQKQIEAIDSELEQTHATLREGKFAQQNAAGAEQR